MGESIETSEAASGAGGSNIEGFRRKRKAGKFSKLRKFGKQGKLGRGFHISAETYSYFLRVYELCNKDEFDTPEDKELFIDNAFTQTDAEEIHLASNQFTSRVLECLFTSTSNSEHLLKFATTFTPSLRTICTDPYASHVLEKLCEIIAEKWYQNKALSKWFRITAKFILNNYEDFVFDKYANHIMRKICQCLSSTLDIFTTKTVLSNASVNRLIIPMELKQDANEEELSDSLRKFRKKSKKVLKGFATQFLNWPQFYDMFENEITSAFVQCLIITLTRVDPTLLNQGVRQVAYTVTAPLDLSSMSKAHMVEACLTVSTEDPEMFQYIFDKFYKGNLTKFSADQAGHYSIERLFYSAPTPDILELIFDELAEDLVKIYQSGNYSVIRSIAESCRRLKTRQSQFVQKLDFLMELDPTSNTNFFDTLLRFGKTNLILSNESGVRNFRTDIHGCYVLQSILEFHKPVKVISSILEYDDSNLAKVAQDPKGSHVIEAFFKSSTVGEKNKEKVLQKLKEYLVEMSCTKFRGRVMDTLYEVCNMKQKTIIATSLCPRESQLSSNSYGKFIAIKYGLKLFKRDVNEWTRVMGEGKKRKAIVDDFISDFGLELDLEKSSLSKKKKIKKEDPDHVRVPA